MSQDHELPLETDVTSVDALRKSAEDFVLLDVRENEEYAIAKIEGSVLLPMSELVDRIDELEPHRDQLIVVHCHHGGRSMQVTQYLRGQGFAKVQNMAGGIDAWSQLIDDTVSRY